MPLYTPPHSSKETNETEKNKAINVCLKFSLLFLCSQVRSIMAMLHKRSFEMFEDGEVILDAFPLPSYPCPCPLFPSSCPLPFPSP